MWLLTRRSLFVRPGRTLLFLCGFALAVGVMIALLSVGEAIVEQASDKAQVGGADIVLVPQGTDVEVLKLGGVTALFSTIPNARLVYRQLLLGPRFAGDIAAAAPAWAGRPVFLRARGESPVVQGIASAVVPLLERAVGNASLPASWRDSAGESLFMLRAGDALYHEMDRWHLPAPGHKDAARWAEWYYFNLLDPASGRYAYLSFFVAGDPRGPSARGSLSIQLGAPGRPPERLQFIEPVDTTALALAGAGVELGSARPGDALARVRFERGAYRLAARFHDRRTGLPVELDLVVEPEPHAYYPPIQVRGSDGFETGYAVPVAIGRASGRVAAGTTRWSFDRALAYHDHNWGYWRSVRWDWGQVQSNDGKYGLVYGRVLAKELDDVGQGGRVFALVTSSSGFLGYLAPEGIEYDGVRAAPRVSGRLVTAPERIRLAQGNQDDSLEVGVRITDVAASIPLGDRPEPGSAHAFLQMRGEFRVRGRVAGQVLDFTAPGAAETFVPLGASPRLPEPSGSAGMGR